MYSLVWVTNYSIHLLVTIVRIIRGNNQEQLIYKYVKEATNIKLD